MSPARIVGRALFWLITLPLLSLTTTTMASSGGAMSPTGAGVCGIAWRKVLVLWITAMAAFWPDVTGSEVNEFCLTETFAAACDEQHVIVLDVARFGRMSVGRCVTRDYGNVGCYTDVLYQVDAKCSGRHSCSFSVSDADLVRTKPCPQDFSSYLEASHHCVKVATVPAEYCRERQELTLHGPMGHISSIATEDAGCGLQTPWTIVALPGQRVNLTLYDFSMATQNESVTTLPRRTSYPMYCQQYARVEETDAARSTIICGGEQRVRNVYLSVTNTVQVHVMNRRVQGHPQYFLIKYQMVGCPNVRAPADTSMRRDGNRVVIICNHTGETTTLSCRGSTWHGEIRNCTPVTPAHIDDDGEGVGLPPIGGLFISPGVSIIIIVGVALVVVVYVAIMIVCVMYLQRRRRRAQQALEDKCHSDTCAADLQLMKPCASSEGLEERVPMLSKPGCQLKGSGGGGLVGGVVGLGEYTDVRALARQAGASPQPPVPQEISLLEQLNQELLEDPQRLGQCECMSTYARACSTFKPKDPIYDKHPTAAAVGAATMAAPVSAAAAAASASRGKRCQVISKGVPFYYELDPKNLHHHGGGGGGGLPGPDVVTVTMCHMKESESESENEVNRLKEQTL